MIPGHDSTCFEKPSSPWLVQNRAPQLPHQVADMQWMHPPEVKSILPQHAQPIVYLTPSYLRCYIKPAFKAGIKGTQSSQSISS